MADLNKLAARIVEQATDEAPREPESAKTQSTRRGGLKGGKVRAARLSPEQRSKIAPHQGATGPPHFSTGAGTVRGAPPVEEPSARSVRVAQWLQTAEARQYDNQWALLDDACHVIDHDASAVALSGRHAGEPDPLMVYVQPPRARVRRA